MGLANWLTLGRIAAVPLLLALFLVPGPEGEGLRLAIFLAASATDWLDGWIARRHGEVSRLGAALDPAADKMLVLGAMFMLAGTGTIEGVSMFAAAAILLREIIVSGIREALGRADRPLTTAALSKWKAAAQMSALAILIAGSLADRVHPLLFDLGIGLLWVAAVLAVWTGVGYAKEALRHVGQGEGKA